MDDADKFGPLKGVRKGVHVEGEMRRDRNVAQLDTPLFSKHLPRNDVRVVFHFG